MNEYKIICGQTSQPKEFEKRCNDLSAEGYKPTGPMVIDGDGVNSDTYFNQQWVKEGAPDDTTYWMILLVGIIAGIGIAQLCQTL